MSKQREFVSIDEIKREFFPKATKTERRASRSTEQDVEVRAARSLQRLRRSLKR